MDKVISAAVWLGALLYELVPMIRDRRKKEAAVYCVLMAAAAAALVWLLADETQVS
ncbi:MAG: hypothetical protein ACOX7P_08860 [Oscillospiraceae bacterium]|jgi:putative copper export protein